MSARFRSAFVWIVHLHFWMAAVATNLTPKKALRFLFIGDSYTYFNMMPTVFEKLCAAVGIRIVHNVVALGGAGLSDFAEGSKFPELHKKAVSMLSHPHGWDYVVLQDEPITAGGGALWWYYLQAFEMKQRSIEALRSFYAPWLRRLNATAVLYATWGRRDGFPPDSMPDYPQPPGFATFSSMTTLIAEGIRSYAAILAPEVPVLIAPCGRAFQFAYDAVVEARGEPFHDDTSRFACLFHHKPNAANCAMDVDGKTGHPSLMGSYMTACVFLGTIFKRSPKGIAWAPPGLNKAEISAAQHFALEASSTYGGGPETTTTTRDDSGRTMFGPMLDTEGNEHQPQQPAASTHRQTTIAGYKQEKEQEQQQPTPATATTTTTFNTMFAGIDATHTVPWWPSCWPPSKMLSISFVLCNVNYHKLISRPSLRGGVSEELRSAIAYEVNNSTESVFVKNVSVELSPGSVTVAAAVKVGSRRMLDMQSQYPLSLSADELGSRLTERMVRVTGLNSVMTGPIEVTNVTISPTNSMAINKLNTWFPGLFGSDWLYTLAALICLFIAPAYCCILKRRPGDPSVGGYRQAPSDAEEQICDEPLKTEGTGTVSTGTCSTTLSTDPLLRELLK